MARAAATARFSTGGAHNLWEGGTHNPWEGPVLIGILIPAWNDHWSLRLGSLSILLRHRPCCSIYYLAVRSFKNHHYSWWTNSVSPPSSALERMVNSWDIYLTYFNFVEFQISSSPSSRFSRMLFIQLLAAPRPWYSKRWQHPQEMLRPSCSRAPWKIIESLIDTMRKMGWVMRMSWDFGRTLYDVISMISRVDS